MRNFMRVANRCRKPKTFKLFFQPIWYYQWWYWCAGHCRRIWWLCFSLKFNFIVDRVMLDRDETVFLKSKCSAILQRYYESKGHQKKNIQSSRFLQITYKMACSSQYDCVASCIMECICVMILFLIHPLNLLFAKTLQFNTCNNVFTLHINGCKKVRVRQSN